MELQRRHLTISGIVQGVGFRPFVSNLAASLSLTGWVYNAGSQVEIEIEGPAPQLDVFEEALIKKAPPLCHIKNISSHKMHYIGYSGFIIKESSSFSGGNIFIPADVSICSDCLKELMDKNDRRYLYPFINCTNCGPRFTIINDVPYDRVNTTMNKFKMCSKCAHEYNDPLNRRYHAQPVSCYKCGPELTLTDNSGKRLNVSNPIIAVQKLLAEGNIIAIKGLGGYHLSCNALNADTVRKLRQRKARDDKPFAVMMKDYTSVLKYCYVNKPEKQLLESPAKPIVLLRRRTSYGDVSQLFSDNTCDKNRQSFASLPDEVAPGNPYLGVMLPYTPLHYLLFHTYPDGAEKDASPDFVPEVLVMTSGNISEEPISYKDSEAIENLSSIADYFLMHDREIYTRVDDSVTRVFLDNEYIIRRSRGYVPNPVTCSIFSNFNNFGMNKNHKSSCTSSDNNKQNNPVKSLKEPKIPSVLACGGELKNTFCINKGENFYLSHHIGDLENAETLNSFEEGINHFKKLFHFEPEIIAYDLHPSYLSTSYALSLNTDKKLAVQHHHAHIASCMAENNLSDEVIGVAFDGTGYGEDGNIWGGEFFTGSYGGFRRKGHLEYIKMPGSEAAIKQPWRMAVSCLYKVFGNNFAKNYSNDSLSLESPDSKNISGKSDADNIVKTMSDGNLQIKCKLLKDIDNYKISSIIQMMDKNLNSPLTSSMGRFFDAASSLLGIRNEIRYEGQAAIELEYIACSEDCGSYAFEFKNIQNCFTICIDEIIKGIVTDIYNNVPVDKISAKFHETIANIVLQGCNKIRSSTGLEKVVLSGGVFQNMLLLKKSISKLEAAGFKVYIHSKVPSNDGGIALGQAVIAAVKMRK